MSKQKAKAGQQCLHLNKFYLLWDSVLQCLKSVISQAKIIRLKMQLDHYCLQPWPKANATGAVQGAEHTCGGTSTDCSSVIQSLSLKDFQATCAGHPAIFIKATALPGIDRLCLVARAKTLSLLFCSIPPFISPESAETSLQGQ